MFNVFYTTFNKLNKLVFKPPYSGNHAIVSFSRLTSHRITHIIGYYL